MRQFTPTRDDYIVNLAHGKAHFASGRAPELSPDRSETDEAPPDPPKPLA
jgi:hypothetical protein